MDELLNDAGGILVMAAFVCLEKFSAVANGMFDVFVILFRRSEILFKAFILDVETIEAQIVDGRFRN